MTIRISQEDVSDSALLNMQIDWLMNNGMHILQAIFSSFDRIIAFALMSLVNKLINNEYEDAKKCEAKSNSQIRKYFIGVHYDLTPKS